MLKTLRTHQIVFLSFAIVSGPICAVRVHAQQSSSAELAKAESFYQARQFQESLILLTELEKRIGADPQRANDLVKVKLYMGLAYMGLNQTDQAKSRFIEICKLDNKFSINVEDFPADAVALYNEAKASCTVTQRPTTATANMSIAQSTFLRGKELYEKGQFTDALKYFTVVLALDTSHDVAREYADLVKQRLDLIADRGYMEWRTSFDARQYDKAASTYTRIRGDQQLIGGNVTTQIESEYRKALSGLADSMRQACSGQEPYKVDEIWNEALNVASGLSFASDALAQVRPCSTRGDTRASISAATVISAATLASTNVAGSPAATGAIPTADRNPQRALECVMGDPLLAMTKLKTRVNPYLDPNLQPFIGRGIRVVVSVQIDEQGEVRVKRVDQANSRIAEAIKSAVEQWKFNPTVIDGQTRCVETDLPIRLMQN